MNYRYEIQVIGDPAFYPNGLVFPTRDEAAEAAHDKFEAWSLAKDYRVVETTAEANCRYFNRRATIITRGAP